MSSLSFLGDVNSYLRIPNTNDFDFGTGDFTIEWYQYQRDTNSVPRIFQVGNYPAISIGVSIEKSNIIEEGNVIEQSKFYYWTNGTANLVKILVPSDYKNKWVHFAICRSNGVTIVFMNGISIFSMNDTNNFNGVDDLSIGNESTAANNSAFGGYMAYFSWVKGTAIHTADFTVSTDYPSLTSDYVLLLTANNFSGTLGYSVINNNVSVIQNIYPGLIPNNNEPYKPNMKNLKSLFTDNSLVYYKPGSLASCGVGTVRNSSTKSRRI